MENEEKKVLDKIDKSIALQEEDQQLKLFNLVQDDLLSFLRNEIKLVLNSSHLKNLFEQKIERRLNPEEDEDEMTDGALLKGLEILTNNETNRSGKILELFKETQKVIIQNNIDDKNQNKNFKNPTENQDYSSEEVQLTKKLLKVFNFVDKLKETEFTMEEKE